jgi:hypothetical protein
MNQSPAPEVSLHRWIKSAVRSLLVSAVAVALLCFTESDSVKPVFEALTSFTPATMWSLIEDANSGCDREAAAPTPASQWDVPGLPGLPRITIAPELKKQAGRRCTAPLVDYWPAAGLWRTRAHAAGWPEIPFLSALLALADVTFHMLVPTTVRCPDAKKTIVGFMSMLQLVLGFGLTVFLVKPVARRLNDWSLALLILVGTLLVGSVGFWAVANVSALIFAATDHLTHGSWIATIMTCTATYGGGISILKFLLEKPAHGLLEDRAESLAETAARLFVHYAP